VKSLGFPATCRLSGKRAFSAVFEHRVRRSAGPLTVYARPNELAWSRLGLSISRRAGPAIQRNRLKRLLREAFRVSRPGLPKGFDWVVVVRGHEPMGRGDYEAVLKRLTEKLANPAPSGVSGSGAQDSKGALLSTTGPGTPNPIP
jgi:ribonuclease P protein component